MRNLAIGSNPPNGPTATAQRLLALAAGVWFKWLLGQPDKRSLVAHDH
jgi:hypothetical protein